MKVRRRFTIYLARTTDMKYVVKGYILLQHETEEGEG